MTNNRGSAIKGWLANTTRFTRAGLTEACESTYNLNLVKVFVSAQIDEKEEARKAFAAFEAAGMSVTHDWTRTDDMSDKWRLRDEAGRRAKLDIDGVRDCDAYVLLSNNKKLGKGMYVELGAALALSESANKPEVFVVGPMNHMSIFYLHPAVGHFETIEDLIFELSSRKAFEGRYPEVKP